MYSGRRRSVNRRRSTQGLSLLEALAAIGLVSAGLLAFTANAVTLTRGAKTADNVGAATALALQKLEQLRSMPLGAAQLTSGQYYDPANNMKADGTMGGIYNRSWQVSLKDTPTWGLKTVTVTVAWTDSKSHNTKVA